MPEPDTLQTTPRAAKSGPVIVLTGGGSGGHITPILAVADEISKLRPDARLVYIGERNGKFQQLTDGHSAIDKIHTIYAGKFRRYHGESWLKRVFDLKTNLLNLRDGAFVIVGTVQSYFLLRKLDPAVVFQKGGFVGMPVGLAAAMRHLMLVTHDSDALPGLANRVVARWAKYHATAMPAEYYNYPAGSVKHVGVLVSHDYQPVTPELQTQYKTDLQVSPSSKVLLVTGGSLGARRINLALVRLAPKLLERFHDLEIFHQVGKGNAQTYGDYQHPRLHVLEFLSDMHRYTGAADLVVTRAGANTLAELGVQGRACVVVPNPLLTGGHQVKNGEYLLQQSAVVVVPETDLDKDDGVFFGQIERLLADSAERTVLGSRLQQITIPDAAERLAMIILELAR